MMLLTTERANKESECNNCRKQTAATIPVVEGSKEKAWGVREGGCGADSQLWGGLFSAAAGSGGRAGGGICAMSLRPLGRECCCCSRAKRSSATIGMKYWWGCHSQRPPAPETLGKETVGFPSPPGLMPLSSNFYWHSLTASQLAKQKRALQISAPASQNSTPLGGFGVGR